MVSVKVAVIGGGVGGLTAIKSCLDAGLQPTCFEKQTWLGGAWNYSDEVLPNMASVHHNTVTNTSKQMMCFSDFPMPKEFPNYLPRHMVQKYLEMYATRFSLEQYIHFNTEVVSLSRSEDFEATGRWVVCYRKLKGTTPECDEILSETFDALMVCCGRNWDQAKPKIPGLERFRGVQVHSGDYRTFHPFVGKRVVVVGCGDSGGDVACELSHHASQVYLSARRGCYIHERLGANGRPTDMQLSRVGQLLPTFIREAFESGFVNTKYNLANFGLQPTGFCYITQYPIVNDALPHRMITGSIVVKNSIKEVTETAVVFDGGDKVDNIDALVFCTGFNLNFPFAKDIICVKEKYTSLYKHVFLPEKMNTLAVVGAVGVGAVGVGGATLPVIEMQARVAAEVFAGRCILPSKDNMIKDVKRRETRLRKIGMPKQGLMHVQFVDYLDELAVMIGAKPDLWSLFMNDPKLAIRCFFGPCVPAQYRLHGPNSFTDARTVINSVEENYLYPLKTRKCVTSQLQRRTSYFFIISLAAFAFVIILYLGQFFSLSESLVHVDQSSN